MACAKAADDFRAEHGPYKGDKVCVDGPEYETAAGCANMGCFDLHFVFEFNFLLRHLRHRHHLGRDVHRVRDGVLRGGGHRQESTSGGLELPSAPRTRPSSCCNQMAAARLRRRVGQGIRYLKEKVARELGADRQFLEDIGMEVKGLEFLGVSGPRSRLAQQAGYSLAVKGPQQRRGVAHLHGHGEQPAAHLRGQGERPVLLPLWRTWFGLLGFCKLLWNDVTPLGNKRFPRPSPPRSRTTSRTSSRPTRA